MFSEGKTKILDLCCGTGTFPRKWLVKLKDVDYTGADINQNFIEFAKEKLKDKRFSFVVGGAVSFRFEQNLILFWQLLHIALLWTAKKDFLKFYEVGIVEGVYKEAGFAVEFLVKKFGKQKLLKLLRSLKGTDDKK